MPFASAKSDVLECSEYLIRKTAIKNKFGQVTDKLGILLSAVITGAI